MVPAIDRLSRGFQTASGRHMKAMATIAAVIAAA